MVGFVSLYYVHLSIAFARKMEKLKVKIEESVDRVSRLEDMAYYILLGTAFLLPIFFIPSIAFPFQFSKAIFVSLTCLTAFALWLIARLKDGRYMLLNSSVYIFGLFVLLVVLASSLVSPVPLDSLVGQGSEVSTWASTVVMFLFMFLFSALFRPKEKVFYLYLALFSSSIILIVFHAFRFVFGADFLSFGLFTDVTSNLIGKWNDLGIFFGLVSFLSLMTLELMRPRAFLKWLLWAVFLLSVFSVILVNFSTLWYVLAFFATLFSVYAYAFKRQFVVNTKSESDDLVLEGNEFDPGSQSRQGRVWRGSIPAMVLIVISAVFLVDYYTESRPVGTSLANRFAISSLEVRPNFISTLSVGKNTLKTDPVFGAGPNRFVNQWLAYKPDGVNDSIFWNTDFSVGFSLLFTQFSMTGVLGFLFWSLFILAITLLGLRRLLTPPEDTLKRYLSISSFFASLYLWTFFVFYAPSTVVLTLTFLFTGVFLASLYNERLLKPKVVTFSDEPKTGFISVFVLTVLLIGVVTLGYASGKRFLASAHYQRALLAVNQGQSIDTVEQYASSAQKLASNDRYSRLMAELYLGKIGALLNSEDASDPDAIRAQFQSLMGEALRYANLATEANKTNYQNWVTLGSIYQAVVPLAIEGSYSAAKSAYDIALALNPRSPGMYLLRARLEVANEDTDAAREEINKALGLKSNYTEAIFLLSQIQVEEGDVREAIQSVESATVLAPNDPAAFFQLGLLKYNNRDWRGAIEAFERAVVLAPTYSNAKYFLGLSYDKVGDTERALTQFNDLMTLNPSNTEVPTIIENIKAGRDPFESARATELPENRDELPVEEPIIEEEE